MITGFDHVNFRDPRLDNELMLKSVQSQDVPT